MKTRQLLALLSAFAALSVGQTIPNNGIRLDGSFNTPYISESGGTAYLQISLKTGNFNLHNTRKPMNIAVVIDRSGSMDDERKMDYAKKAFRRLIEQLEPRDILSVIVYDDKIDVLRSARRIGNDKQSILRILDEISPRNSTNLGGGLIVGLHQAEKNIRKEFVNRVILLSDGLANIGITDPNLLNSIAKEFRRKGVSISTMGVGLDYNENLMMSLAESGGGNYYFIEQPNMLASIVRKEFESVSAVVAQNAVIQLKLDANVRIQDIIGC
ncbi:MAG: VWA domain-containing protein, partial [Bacteroidetes bacterium]|nr:VWA domain-containing protein [Bacteroidota bacterium]